MRRPQGYASITPVVGPPKEMDTFTCCHCSKVVFVQALVDPTTLGGFCTKCMKHLCWRCAGTGVCTPLEQQLEIAEKEARRLIRG